MHCGSVGFCDWSCPMLTMMPLDGTMFGSVIGSFRCWPCCHSAVQCLVLSDAGHVAIGRCSVCVP